MAKSGVRNPLFLLDEIDKMGMDHRGDPASAHAGSARPGTESCLQRPLPGGRLRSFRRDVRCTSNTMNIPGPLLDRMEVIRLPGYTEDEKLNIARATCYRSSCEQNGLKEGEMTIASRIASTSSVTTRVRPVCGPRARDRQESAARWSRICDLEKSQGTADSRRCWRSPWRAKV